MPNQLQSFQSVRTGKVSELIAQQIKETILAGSIAPGEKLPTERELQMQFQASRHSVREAIKILEVSGLVEIRRGSGLFVIQSNAKLVQESFSTLLRMQKVTLNQLATARLIFEPGVTKLACESATEDDLMELERNLLQASQKLDANIPARAENVNFHHILARSTHNPAIVLTMHTLYSLEKDMLHEVTRITPGAIVPSRHSFDYHQKILKALREKKPQKAYELTFEHILVVVKALKKLEGQISKKEQSHKKTI